MTSRSQPKTQIPTPMIDPTVHHDNLPNLLPPRAVPLLRLLIRPRTWDELSRAGYPAGVVAQLAGLLARDGQARIVLGPLLIERLDAEPEGVSR